MITARIEFYDYPTALPTVENSSIKLDLHRRDFTINTMALRLDGRHYGELYDYWGGLHDLDEKLVRVLHSLSFIDDPTRMLRAVRFEQRFDFRIEQRTLELIDEARSMLKQVSGDRLRHEFNLILAEERAPAMLARLQALSLLSAIHPNLRWEASLAASLEAVRAAEPPLDWELPARLGNAPLRLALAYLCWLSCLAPKAARGVSKRLKLPAILANAVQAASALRQDLPALAGARPSQVAVRMEGVPAPALYAVYLAAPAGDLRESLRQYVTRWRHLTAHISGHDLQAMGLPPGPAYREILGALRVARLDGKVNTPEEERAYLNELLEAREDALRRPEQPS